jgi:DNA-binding CsgD family transcriptional regulator
VEERERREESAQASTLAPPRPFVGRRDALDLVGRTLVDPTAPCLLVRGIAGIGKTALVAEAAARAASDGRRVLAVSGRRSPNQLPLEAFAAALPSLGSDPGAGLAAGLARVVRRIDEDGWQALWVDDVAALDPASAQVVHHLAAGSLPTVATARTGDPLPEPIIALRVTGVLEVLALGPLDDREVTQLVEHILGEQVDEATGRRFALLSEGSPLHVRELVRAATAREVLRRDAGILRWDATAGGAWALGGLVRERLAHQAQPVFRAVALVAAAGDLPVGHLTTLVGPEVLAAARDADLLALDAAGSVVPSHPLIAEVLLDGLGADDLHSLHHDLAEALERGPEPEPLRAIAHRTEAGEVPEGCSLLDAGRQALERGSPEVAARLFAAALEAAPAAARVGLGDAAAASGRHDEAEAAYRAALDAGPDLETGLQAVLGLHVVARRAQAVDPADSRALVGRSTEAVTADLAARLRIEGARGLLASGWTEEAAAAVEPVRVDAAVPERTRVAAAAIAARALTWHGRAVDALALVDQARTTAGRSLDRSEEDDELALATIEVLDALGDVARLERFGDECRGRAHRSGPMHGTPDHASEAAAAAAMAAGDPVGAARALRAAISARHALPGGVHRTHVLRAGLVEALALADRLEEAAQELDATTASLPGGPAEAGEPGELGRARAVLVAARGDRAEAAALGAQLVADAAGRGQWGRALASGHLVWRAANPERPLPSLHEAAERAQGPLARAVDAHLEALRMADGEAARRAADLYADLGRWVEAAEAAADAAQAYERSGARRAAVAAALHGDELLSRAEIGRPVRAQPVLEIPTLTPRELEIAGLAAAGLSNRAIAEQLVLSVRTVEGHILRASGKLGVDSREALAVVLTQGRVPGDG